MEAQQLKSLANRAIKFPVTENTDQVIGTPSNRTNKALGFDENGNLSLLGTSGTGSYSTFLTQENTFTEAQTFSKGIISGVYKSNYTAAGTDTYTVTITNYSVYTTGDTYFITLTNANTSATPTLNITSLGAKTIKKEGSLTLVAGDIPAGHEAILRYNGANLILLNPATKQSSFSVHKNGVDQTGLVTNVWTPITFGTEAWDSNNNFASSTFTPTVAKKYCLIAAITVSSPADQTIMIIGLYKNGVRVNETTATTGGTTSGQGVNGTWIVDANGTTDYFEISFWHNKGSNINVQGGTVVTYFMGYIIN